MGIEKVLERVKKLLALAESNNSNESEMAMLKAQELMAKYKLEMKDVLIEEEKKIIDEETNFTYSTKTQWKGTLANVIANNFGCCMYKRTSKKYDEKYILRTKIHVCFVGKEEDVCMCKVVYDYALKTILKRISEKQKELKALGLTTRGLQKDYGFGFTSGLNANFKEQIEKNQQWGLVVVKDKEVVEVYENLNLSKSKSNIKYYASEHYTEGFVDGKNFTTKNVIG